jgi:hypothetical protein
MAATKQAKHLVLDQYGYKWHGQRYQRVTTIKSKKSAGNARAARGCVRDCNTGDVYMGPLGNWMPGDVADDTAMVTLLAKVTGR